MITRILLIAIAVMATGCGSGLHPVRGTVTVDGKPLAGAGVVFVPVDPAGRAAYAETAEDGTYVLKTHTAGDGAMLGEYTVTIVWEEPMHPYEQYRDGAQKKAELEKEYREWKANRKKAASPIPPEYAVPGTTPLKATVPAPGGVIDFNFQSKPK